MGMLGIIGAAWDGYKAAGGAGELAGFAVNIAGLQLAESRIQQNIGSYVANKSEANARIVKANMRLVRDYLRGITVERPGVKDMVDVGNLAPYQVSIALANYATQLIGNIDMAVESGNLPPLDEQSWHSRRMGYQRMRNGALAMTLQFEAAVRRKRKELVEITSFEARLFGLAFSSEMSDADLQMIQHDMDEQKKDENAAKRSLAMFALLANRSRRNYERFGAILEAGDRAAARQR